MNLAGRLALVTGASSGIGAATAKLIGRRAGRVLLLARTQSALDDVAGEIRANGGDARVYPGDVTDAERVRQIAEAITREVGVPDILVNNAGAGRWLWPEHTSPAEAVQMMASPYFGAFYVTRAFLPDMLRRNSGHIVNLTSPAGFVAFPGSTAYSVARWAMRGFSEALRADLHGTPIHVTLVTPGVVSSQYFQHNPGTELHVPGIARLFRTLTPDDVAAAIVRGIERNRRNVTLPPLLALTLQVHRLAPGIVEWMVLRTAPRR